MQSRIRVATPPKDLPDLVSAARARTEATSLRGAAREIGMSPTGLRKMLDGAQPYSPTIRRLRKWLKGREEAA